jgi:hypothetical protein
MAWDLGRIWTLSLPQTVLASQTHLLPSPREERVGRGLGEGWLAKTPHACRVIARLLSTKQAQFIRRLKSPSSPRPSPPLLV